MQITSAWRPVVVTIRRGHGRLSRNYIAGAEVTVSGAAIGELAVLPSVDAKWGYTVTHIRTSMKFPDFYTKDEARKIARDLHNLDWDFDDVEKLPAATKAACVEYLLKRDVTRK